LCRSALSWSKEAAKYGAVGTIVRSMNMRLDDFPHTGTMGYGDLPKSDYILLQQLVPMELSYFLSL
jgi:hypothetical protein